MTDRRNRARSRRRILMLLLGILVPFWAQAAVAEEDAPAPITDEVTQPGALPAPEGLESLFELPSDRSYTIERKGGRTRGEWRKDFAELKEALAEEQKLLSEAEAKLDDVAASTSPWQVGPALPGLQSTEAPLDYQLRQRIKGHKAEVERLERRLRELRVEADLAGVPGEWRG